MNRVLITGGEGDLALEVANQLNEKYSVVCPSKRELDVASKNSVKTFFANKSFDVVINMAGTLYSSEVITSDTDLWIKDIEVNLIGVYLVSRAALLQNKDTLLINVSSTAAFNSYKDWTSYCASKAGVVSLSNGMSKSGHKVVTLCPGAIDTKIRNGISIKNDHVMSVREGATYIVKAVIGEIKPGKILLYRKNMIKYMDESSI